MSRKNSPFRKLKVLKLEFWQETDWMRENCATELENPPLVISRDGWYCLGKVSWFVVNSKAYTTKHLYSSFEYSLSLDFASKYDTKQIKALINLVKFKMPISPLQRKILRCYENYQSSRKCYRESQLYLKKLLTKKKI